MSVSQELVTIEKAVYGGDGLAHSAEGAVLLLPFVLPGERVRVATTADHVVTEIAEASPARIAPACRHFGECGGCQYQMAAYAEQVRLKRQILAETLERAGAEALPEILPVPSPEPFGYRNRVRLRVAEAGGTLRVGYSRRGSRVFLPICMCPIAAPVLWKTLEALLEIAGREPGLEAWLRSSAEVEVACDAQESVVQIHLLCPGKVPGRSVGWPRVLAELRARGVEVVSLGASRLHTASGRAMETLFSAGQDGFAYTVEEGTFWLQRGSFFQVNRFLLPSLLERVTHGRHGELVWDLFAGVGLFARSLAARFGRVTAVEAGAVAARELRRGLRKGIDQVVEGTTLAFLRDAVVQRERPDLVVLDPPRAGAGEEASRLLLRIRSAEIVYVSCDPSTLARDLQILRTGYRVAELHMVDLFPQTYHLETVMVLRRTDRGD